MAITLTSIAETDKPFLFAVYASTRVDEMAMVAWSDAQKKAFLQMQCEAQNHYYRERFPTALFDIVKKDDESIGRLYVAELVDQIRIVELTLLPEHRNQGIGTKLITEILQKGAEQKKPAQIYLESFNRSANLFSRLGFKPIAEEGMHLLWCRKPDKT